MFADSVLRVACDTGVKPVDTSPSYPKSRGIGNDGSLSADDIAEASEFRSEGSSADVFCRVLQLSSLDPHVS